MRFAPGLQGVDGRLERASSIGERIDNRGLRSGREHARDDAGVLQVAQAVHQQVGTDAGERLEQLPVAPWRARQLAHASQPESASALHIRPSHLPRPTRHAAVTLTPRSITVRTDRIQLALSVSDSS
jgi:hypothetical protein